MNLKKSYSLTIFFLGKRIYLFSVTYYINSTLLLKFYLLGMRKIFTSVSGLFPCPRGGKHGLKGHFEITSEASDFKGSVRLKVKF